MHTNNKLGEKANNDTETVKKQTFHGKTVENSGTL
jgi:hypothetical protein